MNSTTKKKKSGPKVIKFFSCSTEYEIFSAKKYENANNNWHFYIYKQRNVHDQLYLARMNLQFLEI